MCSRNCHKISKLNERILIRLTSNIHSIQCPFFSFMPERFPGGQFRFKWWGKTHAGSSHRRRSVNLWLWLLPSLISCHSEKTWLWIPHWDGHGPEGLTSQSPGCSSAQEQLQPPSARSTLHLPEWSVCHLLCYDRDDFNEIKCKLGVFISGVKDGCVQCSTEKMWDGWNMTYFIMCSSHSWCKTMTVGIFSHGAEHCHALRTAHVTICPTVYI